MGFEFMGGRRRGRCQDIDYVAFAVVADQVALRRSALADARRMNEPRVSTRGVAPTVRSRGIGDGVDVTHAATSAQGHRVSAANASGRIPVVPDAVGVAGVCLFVGVLCRRPVSAPSVASPDQGPGPGTETGGVAGGEGSAGGEVPTGEVAFPAAFPASSRALYTSGRN